MGTGIIGGLFDAARCRLYPPAISCGCPRLRFAFGESAMSTTRACLLGTTYLFFLLASGTQAANLRLRRSVAFGCSRAAWDDPLAPYGRERQRRHLCYLLPGRQDPCFRRGCRKGPKGVRLGGSGGPKRVTLDFPADLRSKPQFA
jgi:hypothetical protein